MKTYSIKTLGCKVNQYEGHLLGELLEQRGFRPAGYRDPCRLIVVNTCTVTGEADRKSRYEIRRLHRENRNAHIIVTGCYAERERHILKKLPGVRAVIGQREKSKFLEHLDRINTLNLDADQPGDATGLYERGISRFYGRGRAFLKIQDGCNKSCAFCKVVIVRGRLRSRPPKAIVEEARRLVAAGYRELVLTGIQLGAYGLDRPQFGSLLSLMGQLVSIRELKRLRLSSINPYDVDDDLIDFIAGEPKCCPHLHIPLQSGSNRVLARMRRGYTREEYMGRIDRLYDRVRHFSLTLDAMVGFPGERESDFNETLDLLRTVRPLKIHAFPYSDRPATRASRMDECVSPLEIKNRMKRIVSLGIGLRQENMRRWMGRSVSFLVEEHDVTRKAVKGITPNYMPVVAPGDAGLVGTCIDRTVMRICADALEAA